MKKTEMGRTCSTYRVRRAAHKTSVGKAERRGNLEEQGNDGSKILLWIYEKWVGA
jgi:hypothetical protein